MTGHVRTPDERFPGLAEVQCDHPTCTDTVDVGTEHEDGIADARAQSRTEYGWSGSGGDDYCEIHGRPTDICDDFAGLLEYLAMRVRHRRISIEEAVRLATANMEALP